MWKRTWTRYFGALFIAACFFSFWPSAGGCSESRTYQISETELTALQSHLNALEQNNAALMMLLSESNDGLTIAAEELTKLRQELTEAKKRLAESQTSLMQMQLDAEDARRSLATANEELRKASESFKASERERDRIEGRLRTQRNIWEALFAVAVGVAVAR